MNKLYLGKLSVSWSHRTVRSLEMSDTKRLFKSASQNKKKAVVQYIDTDPAGESARKCKSKADRLESESIDFNKSTSRCTESHIHLFICPFIQSSPHHTVIIIFCEWNNIQNSILDLIALLHFNGSKNIHLYKILHFWLSETNVFPISYKRFSACIYPYRIFSEYVYVPRRRQRDLFGDSRRLLSHCNRQESVYKFHSTVSHLVHWTLPKGSELYRE